MTSRIGIPNTAGLAFKLCLFFAANPDEMLYTADVAEKFQTQRAVVCSTLTPMVRKGWLAYRGGKMGGNSGRATQSVYSAGPRLLEMLGLQ